MGPSAALSVRTHTHSFEPRRSQKLFDFEAQLYAAGFTIGCPLDREQCGVNNNHVWRMYVIGVCTYTLQYNTT